MPSKDPVVLKRNSQKYKKSAHGRAKINATKKVWAKTDKGQKSIRASGKEWRKTTEYKAGMAARAKIRRAKRKQWLREIKSKMSCSECGYNKHPAALQFHHLRDKTEGITKLVCNTSKNFEFIQAEMAKCIVLCACCHAILHDEESTI